MLLVEKCQAINDNYYGRFMSYASKLMKKGKKKEAKEVHNKAQQLNKYFYLAAHTDNVDLVVGYSREMETIVTETNRFVKGV